MTPRESGLSHKMTREQFMAQPTDEKLGILFDVLVENSKNCTTRMAKCAGKFKQLDERKWFDKTLSTIAGGIGGAITSALGIKL